MRQHQRYAHALIEQHTQAAHAYVVISEYYSGSLVVQDRCGHARFRVDGMSFAPAGRAASVCSTMRSIT